MMLKRLVKTNTSVLWQSLGADKQLLTQENKLCDFM